MAACKNIVLTAAATLAVVLENTQPSVAANYCQKLFNLATTAKNALDTYETIRDNSGDTDTLRLHWLEVSSSYRDYTIVLHLTLSQGVSTMDIVRKCDDATQGVNDDVGARFTIDAMRNATFPMSEDNLQFAWVGLCLLAVSDIPNGFQEPRLPDLKSHLEILYGVAHLRYPGDPGESTTCSTT
jgi:hypothetical protein